jgi:MFS family permease
MIITGLLLAIFFLPAPAFVDGLAPTVAFMVCLGLVTTLIASPVSPAVTSAVDAMGSGGGGYSSAFGLVNLAYAAGMMVGPLVGGVSVDIIGIKPSLVIFGLGFGAYALMVGRLLPQERCCRDAN